jgi:large subunit ribosomal protein L17
LAKKDTLAARRLALARLRDKEAVELLFKEIAPLFANREGGYTRVLKRQERRLGDGGQTAFLELVLESRSKEISTTAPVIEAEVKS